jgi:hypothetical protein
MDCATYAVIRTAAFIFATTYVVFSRLKDSKYNKASHEQQQDNIQGRTKQQKLLKNIIGLLK